MVALSHATARALGYGDHESEGKPFVEVSGRKGLGVKADDLIDRLIGSATAEVAERNPDMDGADRDRAARVIATAALRYFLVKFTRTKVIAFDIDEALSFEGETGPYLQYATVRAGNILAKLAERDGTTEDEIVRRLPELSADPITTGDDADELWGLVLEAVAARRGRRDRDPVARAVARREVRLRPRAGVQRVLPPPADSEGRSRRCAPLARGGRRLHAPPADAGARSDGM